MQITVTQNEIPEGTMFPLDLCYDGSGFNFEVPFELLGQIPCSQIHSRGRHIYTFPDNLFRSFAEHMRDQRK